MHAGVKRHVSKPKEPLVGCVSLRSLGAPNPRPLRSPEQLFGISDLTPSESTRVQAANKVYTTAEVLIYHCFLLQIFILLENPERSSLWQFGSFGQAWAWNEPVSHVLVSKCYKGPYGTIEV